MMWMFCWRSCADGRKLNAFTGNLPQFLKVGRFTDLRIISIFKSENSRIFFKNPTREIGGRIFSNFCASRTILQKYFCDFLLLRRSID